MTLTVAQAARLTTDQLRDAWQAAPPDRELLHAFRVQHPAKFDALRAANAAWLRHQAQVSQLVYYRVVNPDAVKLHLSVAREFGIQGGRRCIPLTAPILMADGSWKALGDISLNDRVIAADPVTGEGRPASVTAVHRAGMKEVFRIGLADGGFFDASADHEVPISTRYNKQPQKMRIGAFLDRIPTATENARVAAWSPTHIEFDSPSPLPLHPYLLGALIGDGGLSGHPLKFHNTDPAVLERVAHHLRALGVTMVQDTHTPVTWCLTHTVGGGLDSPPNPLRGILNALGLAGHTAHTKFIPEAVFTVPVKERLEFLAGLIDTDGTRDQYTTVSDRLAADFVRLVKSFGGRATISEHIIRQRGRTFRANQIYWRLSHQLPLALPHKQGDVTLQTFPTNRRTCRTVKPLGVMECGDLTVDHPAHCFVTGDHIIVANSGKTGAILAETAVQMTGVVPMSLATCRVCAAPMDRDPARGTWDHRTAPVDGHAAVLRYPLAKLRPPIRVRLVVTSNVNAWDENLKQKLQYSQWNGKLNEYGLAGDPRYGHWGFIPQRFLFNGSWDDSWSERHRKLTLNLHGDGGTVPGSTMTVMSHQQALEDFNQGSYHLILEDEIPPEEIHRANRLRTLDVQGQIITGGTPPDDRPNAVASAWFFDLILGPGLQGGDPAKVEAVALWTEHNRTLDKDAVEELAQGLTPEQRRATLRGESLHLAGIIIRGFTEKARAWCLRCNAELVLGLEACALCGGRDLVPYRHVFDEEDLAWPGPREWPTVFIMDPHQTKPTACGWFRVDPNDAGWMMHELEVEGDAQAVKDACEAIERQHGLHPLWRKGDPKITAQGNQFAKTYQGQDFNIRTAFEEVGFYFDDANTNFTVGIDRLERLLKVNPYTRAPGLRFHESCRKSIHQIQRFTFEKDKPSKKNSDFPALARYFAIADYSYRGLTLLQAGHPVAVAARRVGRSVVGW